MTMISAVTDWSVALEELVAGIGDRFCQAASRRRALAYLRGLPAPLDRKNGWHLAEAAGDVSPAAMQDFLNRSRWDADAVRDDLQAYVIDRLGDEQGVLVLDETGFVKKGLRIAGKRPTSYAASAFPVTSAALVQFQGSNSSMRLIL